MDRGETGVINHGRNHVKAIDQAIYLNFVSKETGVLYYAIQHKHAENLVISDDLLEFLDNVIIHPLKEDYHDMGIDHVNLIAGDIDPLLHWEEIRGMLTTLENDILRFILEYKIPIDQFAKQELAARGYDGDGNWVGFEKALEIWKNYKSK